jgi:hypothetical protein
MERPLVVENVMKMVVSNGTIRGRRYLTNVVTANAYRFQRPSGRPPLTYRYV